MESNFKTEQESFWAGEFGNAYVQRNDGAKSLAARTAQFSKILSRTQGVSSVLELGANIGYNLHAIQRLLPDCAFTGVEINATAVEQLQKVGGVKIHQGSMFHFTPEVLGQHDFTLSAGVLIHINPNLLQDAYQRLYECSRSYICIIEYYNPSPVELAYRGNKDRLFKRDFAGEIMDRYSDLELVDYGFQYRRDSNFPADDTTWFLLKKK